MTLGYNLALPISYHSQIISLYSMFYRGENYFVLNFQNLYLDKLPQRNRTVAIRLSSSDLYFLEVKAVDQRVFDSFFEFVSVYN